MENNFTSTPQQQQGLSKNNSLNQISNDDNELYNLALLAGVQMEYSTFKYEKREHIIYKFMFHF